MERPPRLPGTGHNAKHIMAWGDVIVPIGIAAVIYAGLHLAAGAPAVIRGPRIFRVLELRCARPWSTILHGPEELQISYSSTSVYDLSASGPVYCLTIPYDLNIARASLAIRRLSLLTMQSYMLAWKIS